MSSVRVDSPLFTEFRRQPSPRAPTMPKPRACRKLFPVDHAETNHFVQAEIAKVDAEDRAKFGFDFGRYVPLEDQSSSRYTDWEAAPAASVPSFYRETVARSKPVSRRRPPAFSSVSSQQHRTDSHFQSSQQNRNDGCFLSSFSSTGSTTTRTDQTPAERRTQDTGTVSSFVPLDRQGGRPRSLDHSTKNFVAVTLPKPCPEEAIQTVLGTHGTVSISGEPCSSSSITTYRSDQWVNAGPSVTSKPLTAKSVVDKQQSKVTDYFRQRKRSGSCTGRGSPFAGAGDRDEHQISRKRRTRSADSPDVEAPSPEAGQS